jgi:hypothetical protein
MLFMWDPRVENSYNVVLSHAEVSFWSFVQDALGPDWQGKDLGDFLETHNTRNKRRPF